MIFFYDAALPLASYQILYIIMHVQQTLTNISNRLLVIMASFYM